MSWQDMVLAVGQVIFIIALLPSVFSKNKPALSSSLITTVVLVIYIYTFSTLSLWMSAIFTALLAICWGTLALQKYREMKKIEKKKGS